jgi:hypothetical protein
MSEETVFVPPNPVIQRRSTQGVHPEETVKLRRALTEKFAAWGLPDPRQDGFVLEDFLSRILADAAEHSLFPRQLGVTFENLMVQGSGQSIAHGKTFTVRKAC